MGLFSGKSKTHVASTLYNLAGDPTGKPTFKRTAVAGAIVRGTNIPGDMRNAYLSGYGISMKSFARWAETSGYNDRMQMSKTQLALQSSFNRSLVQEHLQATAEPGETIEVLQAGVGPADLGYWADQYMIENYLAADTENWQADLQFDYDVLPATSSLLVRIGPTPAQGVTDDRPAYVVPVTGFNPSSSYLWAVYRGNTSGDATRSVLGDWRVIDGIAVQVPNLTNWTLDEGTQDVPTPVTLNTVVTVVTKPGNGPAVAAEPVVTPRLENASVTEDKWTRTVNIGGSKTPTLDLEEEKQVIERSYGYQIKQKTTVTVALVDNPLLPAVKSIVTTTTVRDEMVPYRRYRQSVDTVTTRRYGPIKMMIYEIGSGNAVLDGLHNYVEADVDWVPFIPLRLENRFVRDIPDTDVYQWTKRAFKKAFGRNVKIEEVITALEDNEALSEIDFAHIAIGVPLNTKSTWGRLYIYKFLLRLIETAGVSKEQYTLYNQQLRAYETYVRAMQVWNSNQEGSGPIVQPPTKVDAPIMPSTIAHFKSDNAAFHFHHTLEFGFLFEEQGTGRKVVNGKPVKIGDLWWETLADEVKPEELEDNRDDPDNVQPYLANTVLQKYDATHALYWQVSSRVWKRILVRGGKHINYAYGNHSVQLYVADALEDEEDSGFFFPINLPIFKSLGLTKSTELYNCSAYIILNSYQVVKKKWYQTGIFAVIIVIVLIVVSYFFPPAAGTAGGILGTNTAVGTAIVGAGASASVIALVGAVANAIAGMVLGAILSRVAGKLFGNSFLAQIFTFVAMFLIGNYQASGGTGGMSFAESFGSLMRAENLLRLAMSAVNGLTEYLAKGTMTILQEAEALREAYSAESRRIQEMYVEQFGAGKVIDPMAFTSAGSGKVESLDTFLQRTLMTGMDIAEATHEMLSDFCSMTLTLETKV